MLFSLCTFSFSDVYYSHLLPTKQSAPIRNTTCMHYKELPPYTNQQEHILDLVFKFRFINRKQLQTILGHKDARRINMWLKDLVDKKYLGRIYSYTLLENTKPAIYYLENNGILYCKHTMTYQYQRSDDTLLPDEVKKLYATKKASQTFITRCLFMVDLYVQATEQERKTGWEYSFTTKSEIGTTIRNYRDYSERKQYIPDAHMEKIHIDEKTGNVQDDAYYISYFDPHAPLYAMKYNVRQHLAHRQEPKYWRVDAGIKGEYPHILMIIPNQIKANKLAHFIQETLNDSYDVEDVTFSLTTVSKIVKNGLFESRIWQEITEE